jgi:hypothetical protein
MWLLADREVRNNQGREIMNTTSELNTLVGEALDGFGKTKRYHVFSLDEIAAAIENSIGQKLDDGARGEIREIMLRRWGSGVEPAAIGAELWRFGYSKPPVSQEIGRR